MGESTGAARPRQLRRLTREGSGVVTINVRSSRILVFWASHDLLVPVEPGWYLHAASVEGRTSVVDGERQLDARFDLEDPQVRWQHARIDRLGGADLFLEKGRRYLFYLTPGEASREVLLQSHLPWPSQLRPPKAKGEPTVLAFQAWPLQLDYHRENGVISPKGKPRDPSLVSFDSWEHESIAAARTWGGLSVHDMIDMWAFRGLIDGGAIIDTRSSFEEWNFWCPGEEPSATPANPYALPRPVVAIDPLDGAWHYVIPEQQIDPQSRTQRPWTASALKDAMRSGRAAALTIGEAIMVGGDVYETPSEMETDGDRWKNPQNIMRLYWEARQWLEGRNKALASGAAGVYCWQGYLQRYGVVYLVFGLLMTNPEALAKPSTVDEMLSIGEGEVDEDIGVPPPENPKGNDRHCKADRARLRNAFDRLTLRARKVDAMVDLLRQASGASRFTEIQFIAQTLATAAQGKGGTLAWMQSRLPWLTHLHPQRDLANAGFTQDEIKWFETSGVDDQLMQIVGTNGRYGDLGLKNWTHFSDGGLNFKEFERFHRTSLALVVQHCKAPDSVHPIPARALFHTAFGCHFLTDAFSASHMRVPRKKLGAFSAKLMHDIDGLVGLWVYNLEDPKHPWYAFGDTHLHSKTVSGKQWKLLDRAGGNPALAEENFQHAAGAVGSAFKQLHYQAHSLRQSEPGPPGPSVLNSTLRGILDANGPTDGVGPQGYKWEKRALDDILRADPLPADLTKATHLRSETLAPGNDALGSPPKVWERLRMSIDGRIGYLKRLVPIPLPAALRAPPYVPDGPTSIHDAVNILPLFSPDGKTISGDDNPYDIVVSAGSPVRGISPYQGFSLRVKWEPYGDFWDDDAELRLNYDKYYFMTKFFKDVHGMEFLIDTTLLDVYDKLPQEHS